VEVDETISGDGSDSGEPDDEERRVMDEKNENEQECECPDCAKPQCSTKRFAARAREARVCSLAERIYAVEANSDWGPDVIARRAFGLAEVFEVVAEERRARLNGDER